MRPRRIRALISVPLAFLVLAVVGRAGAGFSSGGSSEDSGRDTMQLTDDPGNWFTSERTRTPVTVVDPGGRVDFVIGPLTQTRHTVTLISKPTTSRLQVDQDQAIRGSVGVEFDRPGVYLFTPRPPRPPRSAFSRTRSTSAMPSSRSTEMRRGIS